MKDGILFSQKVIKDIFNYQYLDMPLLGVYSYFDNKFKDMFDEYSNLFNIKNNFFYIQNNDQCNAFAKKCNSRNIIAITNGYPILMNDKLKKIIFDKFILLRFINDMDILDAFCDLQENANLQFDKFVLDCSIQFTFSHEFQHILQMNYGVKDILFQENFELHEFDLKRHIWEFDADRMASHEVLKLVYSYFRKLKSQNDGKLKCLLILGCTSMLLTKCLFYFGIMNQVGPNYKIMKRDFYLKQYSHPHPLVRTFNILEFYYDSMINDFPKLNMDSQTLLNSCMGFLKVYFDSILPDNTFIEFLFNDLELYIDNINKYNRELYDFAIQDEEVKNVLDFRNIKY